MRLLSSSVYRMVSASPLLLYRKLLLALAVFVQVGATTGPKKPKAEGPASQEHSYKDLVKEMHY